MNNDKVVISILIVIIIALGTYLAIDINRTVQEWKDQIKEEAGQ